MLSTVLSFPTKFLCLPISKIHRETELYVLQESAIYLHVCGCSGIYIAFNLFYFYISSETSKMKLKSSADCDILSIKKGTCSNRCLLEPHSKRWSFPSELISLINRDAYSGCDRVGILFALVSLIEKGKQRNN